MVFLQVIFVLIFVTFSQGLNNGLGLKPQMGWNSWNHFRCNFNETVIRQIADAIVSSGLNKAGYEYVNLDDCWAVSRDANGTVQPDPIAFPSGFKALADYVHSKGLKFGLYSDRGNATCAGRPGSLGYETKDAETYAHWGVDYLKFDSCYGNGTPAMIEYGIMRDALNATGRPIFYSLCGGVNRFDMWPPSTGNSWRTTDDIQDSWASMISNIDQNNEMKLMGSPGGWNDPDMLEIGNGNMTDEEYISHFSLWAITKSPLIIGCDVTQMSAATLSTLTNPEAIAVNQDSLGVQGKKIAVKQSQLQNTSSEVIVTNCSGSTLDPKRHQWIYNPQDGSIRSAYNGKCLSIDRCSTRRETYIVLNDCQINHPQAECKGKNQQWTIDTTNKTIVSQMAGYCLEVHNTYGPSVYALICTRHGNQMWTWDSAAGTITSQSSGGCLTVPYELEIWAGPLAGGSQAVLLLNRGGSGSEEITVQWNEIGFPQDRSAQVRDLWTHQDLGIFTGSYTSPKLNSHAVMLLNITLTKHF